MRAYDLQLAQCSSCRARTNLATIHTTALHRTVLGYECRLDPTAICGHLHHTHSVRATARSPPSSMFSPKYAQRTARNSRESVSRYTSRTLARLYPAYLQPFCQLRRSLFGSPGTSALSRVLAAARPRAPSQFQPPSCGVLLFPQLPLVIPPSLIRRVRFRVPSFIHGHIAWPLS
jgi:hypothetical protein